MVILQEGMPLIKEEHKNISDILKSCFSSKNLSDNDWKIYHFDEPQILQ